MKDTMLSRLLKSIGATPEAASEVAPADLAALQTEFDAFKAQAQADQAELSTALETAVNAVKEADAKVAELTAAAEALQAELTQLKAAQAEAEAKAVAQKQAARKAKIVAAVGTAKADSLMEATSGMEDAAFDAVLSAMTGAVASEAKSQMFTEVGATADVDPSKTPAAESKEAQILRQKYKGTAQA